MHEDVKVKVHKDCTVQFVPLSLLDSCADAALDVQVVFIYNSTSDLLASISCCKQDFTVSYCHNFQTKQNSYIHCLPTSSAFCWYITLAFKGLIAATRVRGNRHTHRQASVITGLDYWTHPNCHKIFHSGQDRLKLFHSRFPGVSSAQRSCAYTITYTDYFTAIPYFLTELVPGPGLVQICQGVQILQ